MHLSVRLLGVEVLGISTDPPPPTKGDGVGISRHAGYFEMGFQPSIRWSSVERHHPGP